jgi:hypothetical protein
VALVLLVDLVLPGLLDFLALLGVLLNPGLLVFLEYPAIPEYLVIQRDL